MNLIQFEIQIIRKQIQFRFQIFPWIINSVSISNKKIEANFEFKFQFTLQKKFTRISNLDLKLNS